MKTTKNYCLKTSFFSLFMNKNLKNKKTEHMKHDFENYFKFFLQKKINLKSGYLRC